MNGHEIFRSRVWEKSYSRIVFIHIFKEGRDKMEAERKVLLVFDRCSTSVAFLSFLYPWNFI